MKAYIRSMACAVLLVLGLVVCPTVGAAPVSFNLTYAGINGSSATGTGFITFDDALLPNPGRFFNRPTVPAGVLDFSLTIAGASVGNGTFDLSNITRWIWRVDPPAVDLTMELVGQAGFRDFNLGTIGQTAGAPGGVERRRIVLFYPNNLPSRRGEILRLTSMQPVPEPGTLLLMGSGLVGLLGWRYRQANNV